MARASCAHVILYIQCYTYKQYTAGLKQFRMRVCILWHTICNLNSFISALCIVHSSTIQPFLLVFINFKNKKNKSKLTPKKEWYPKPFYIHSAFMNPNFILLKSVLQGWMQIDVEIDLFWTDFFLFVQIHCSMELNFIEKQNRFMNGIDNWLLGESESVASEWKFNYKR